MFILHVIMLPFFIGHLHVAPINHNAHILVAPQIQGGPVTAVQALQPTTGFGLGGYTLQ